MPVNWSVVKKIHVEKACDRIDAGIEKPSRSARNTFLLHRGKRYDAKFVRGLAYQLSTGSMLNPSLEYNGGAETARFFKNLGYTIEYRKQVFVSVKRTQRG
ncbi:MAG TPA: hypothetical protein PKV48_07185, partial [Thermodesulfobacteriota bacterium]|nr:hypothetical protein [Thermodesulfobacteriota bacterium]